jgi:hypothetical protein
VESAKDELGAAEVDGVADEGVDDLHERGLDGLLVFDEGDGVKARFGRRSEAANHALVEGAENFGVERGRAATDSVDLDVSTAFRVLIGRHWIHLSDLESSDSDRKKFKIRSAKLLIWLELA